MFYDFPLAGSLAVVTVEGERVLAASSELHTLPFEGHLPGALLSSCMVKP